jgi:hypothetical protein
LVQNISRCKEGLTLKNARFHNVARDVRNLVPQEVKPDLQVTQSQRVVDSEDIKFP